MDLIPLTQKIVSIPSYFDKKVNEKELGEFIFNYYKKNVKNVQVSKQVSKDGRFNVIVKNTDNPRILFSSHMDTIQPPGDFDIKKQGTIKGNKLFGLGAVDMKAGLTASIKAIEEMQDNLPPFMAVYDFDEEYYFKGILDFLEEYGNIRPELAVFTEPTDMKIVNGCRGLIEIVVDIFGQTGHGSRPDKAVNAIEEGVELIQKLKNELIKFDAKKELSKTTINFSSIQGGLYSGGTIVKQANSVPDIARVLFEIRTANYDIDPIKTKQLMQKIAKALCLKIGDMKVNLFVKPCLTLKKDLGLFETAVQKTMGQIDYEPLLWAGGLFEGAYVQPVLECACVSFGPGPKGVEFTQGEYVNIDQTKQTKDIYVNILQLFQQNKL